MLVAERDLILSQFRRLSYRLRRLVLSHHMFFFQYCSHLVHEVMSSIN